VIGQTVSHYRITSRLGEGGMGAVYRAEDLTLQRPVALKLLPTDLVADPRARRSLLQEARVASRLNHPNIATIYEVSDAGDAPFIAMELVEGESLKEVLARGPLSQERMSGLAKQIAEGLLEAHRAKVLHRDIKPGNVMIDGRGRVKILDFGLAVLSGRERPPDETAQSFVSRSGSRCSTGGTVPYMPPEQLRGQTTDARGDIFSFGALVYECLTGRLPFPGETAVDVMHAILHDTPVPMRSHRPDLSAAWGDLVDRCLSKEPAQRPGSVEDLLEALKAVRGAAPASAPADSKAEKSVAVLYFENLSGSGEDEYFRDGITEDVITELSKIREIRVFPRSTVLPYRNRSLPAPQIGRELGARFVLTGSLRRAGNRLRITAQLVETRTDTFAWTERFDRQMEDVFAIQDEIAQNIARALRVVLTEEEKQAIEKRPTADVQAYDYYLRGRQFFHQYRRKGLDYARQMFARAIVIDPNYARAYAGLGRKDAALEADRRCVAAAEKHLELHPDDARALYLGASSLARLGDRSRGIEWARRALDADPDEQATLYNVACVYSVLGRHDEAIECLEKAVQHGFSHVEWVEHDSDFTSLRGHPRFKALLEKLR
jgi:non-specific serine/threonine protein kinase